MSLPPGLPIHTGGVIELGDAPIRGLHFHDCLEIGICHNGSGIFVIEKEVSPFSQGDVSIIPKYTMHLAKSVIGTRSNWSFVFLDPIAILGNNNSRERLPEDIALSNIRFKNLVSSKKHPEIGQLLLLILDELVKNDIQFESAIRGLVRGLLVKILRLSQKLPDEAQSTTTASVDRIAPALDRIALHYNQPITIVELAEQCNMCVTNMRRLFRQTLGKSPQDYLANFRIQMAARLLLNTEWPVLNISIAVGYRTLSSFNRHFRKYMGSAPREYRRQKQLGSNQGYR